jgi:hypothetical protein
MTRRIHDPAQKNRDQHERDESTDQRPVHGGKHIRARGDARITPASLRGRSGMLGQLLAGRRERPRDLLATFLAEDEAQLAGRTQAIGVGWTEGAAGAGPRYSTEQVLLKEAVLTLGLRRRRRCRHRRPTPRSDWKLEVASQRASKRISPPHTSAISGKRRNFSPAGIPANCGVFVLRTGRARNFRSFVGRT